MYLESANAIIDVNSLDNYYIIFLDNGFKYEYTQYSKKEKPYGCPDKITETDIKRAKEHDGKDISYLKGKVFTTEEIEENINRAENFLISEKSSF